MLPTTKLDILFEDEHIIVCKKPAGLATQTRNLRSLDMESLIKRHLYRTAGTKKEPYLGVIHRLDQPVSGILVFAKSPLSAKILNQELQNKAFTKQYKALLTSPPPSTLAGKPLINYMKKDGRTNTSCICSSKDTDSKTAILTYNIIPAPSDADWNLFAHCGIADYTLLTPVHIDLETGRHHQIRLQMSHLGCPIWGDTKYGPNEDTNGNWEQIALCAYSLTFTHPTTKKVLSFHL